MRQALLDLAEIEDFIAKNNPAAAQDVVARIEASAKSLKEFPALGRPSDQTDVRLIQPAGLPYLLPYRVVGETVEIICVYDMRRKRPSAW
jgi:toxin ParE1/3/4